MLMETLHAGVMALKKQRHSTAIATLQEAEDGEPTTDEDDHVPQGAPAR